MVEPIVFDICVLGVNTVIFTSYFYEFFFFLSHKHLSKPVIKHHMENLEAQEIIRSHEEKWASKMTSRAWGSYPPIPRGVVFLWSNPFFFWHLLFLLSSFSVYKYPWVPPALKQNPNPPPSSAFPPPHFMSFCSFSLPLNLCLLSKISWRHWLPSLHFLPASQLSSRLLLHCVPQSLPPQLAEGVPWRRGANLPSQLTSSPHFLPHFRLCTVPQTFSLLMFFQIILDFIVF